MTATTTLSSNSLIALSKLIRETLRWSPGLELALIPKGKGLRLMPVPSFADLADIARGARTDGVRDRDDRF